MKDLYLDARLPQVKVIEELARARYKEVMSNPVTRKQLLREVVKIIHKEVLDIQSFAIDEDMIASQDEAKKYFFEYEFICLESFMCDAYFDRYSPVYHYPRIFSI